MTRYAAPRQLSDTAALVIRAAAHAKVPTKRLVERYGVTRQTIEKVIRRETYRQDADGQDMPALMLPYVERYRVIDGVAEIAPNWTAYTATARTIRNVLFPDPLPERKPHPMKGVKLGPRKAKPSVEEISRSQIAEAEELEFLDAVLPVGKGSQI
jgi:hypothetical protein